MVMMKFSLVHLPGKDLLSILVIALESLINALGFSGFPILIRHRNLFLCSSFMYLLGKDPLSILVIALETLISA